MKLECKESFTNFFMIFFTRWTKRSILLVELLAWDNWRYRVPKKPKGPSTIWTKNWNGNSRSIQVPGSWAIVMKANMVGCQLIICFMAKIFAWTTKLGPWIGVAVRLKSLMPPRNHPWTKSSFLIKVSTFLLEAMNVMVNVKDWCDITLYWL